MVGFISSRLAGAIFDFIFRKRNDHRHTDIPIEENEVTLLFASFLSRNIDLVIRK